MFLNRKGTWMVMSLDETSMPSDTTTLDKKCTWCTISAGWYTERRR
jgi:hypothetical protein